MSIIIEAKCKRCGTINEIDTDYFFGGYVDAESIMRLLWDHPFNNKCFDCDKWTIHELVYIPQQ